MKHLDNSNFVNPSQFFRECRSHFLKIGLLVVFPSNLLSIALPSQCLLDTLLLSWLQIKGVLLYFFNNILGLDLSLKATESIFQRLSFLKLNLSHSIYTPCQEK